MNKKTPIISIIAVVVLTLVSFTSVVGYQIVKSDSKIVSPLFNVRTNDANDKNTKQIKSDYVGKDEKSLHLYSESYDKKDEIEHMMDVLVDMDDVTFDKFVKQFIDYVHQKNEVNNNEISDKEISDMVYLIRNNQEVMEDYLMLRDNNPMLYTVPDVICIILGFYLLLFIFIVSIPIIILGNLINLLIDFIQYIFSLYIPMGIVNQHIKGVKDE